MRANLNGTVYRYTYATLRSSQATSLRSTSNGDRVLQELDDNRVELARHITESGSYYAPWLYPFDELRVNMKRTDATHMCPMPVLSACPERSRGAVEGYDGTGNTRKLTDGAGGGPAAYTYDAFGKYQYGWQNVTNPFRYGGAWGYITDTPGSGLLQLGHRFYWPEVGRFVQQDPVGSEINWYEYAAGNPLKRTDPSGEVAPALLLVGKIVVGAVLVWQGYECGEMAYWWSKCMQEARRIRDNTDAAAWEDLENCPTEKDLWQRVWNEAQSSEECKNYHHYEKRCYPAHLAHIL